jgi:hypothetical protein
MIAATLFVACFANTIVCAQNAFRWRPGERPNQFWIATQRSGCENVRGQQGVWMARTIFAEQETKTWTCSYVWTSDRSSVPELSVLQRVADRLEQDVPIVSTSASDPELEAFWFEPLYERARSRLDIPEARDPQPAQRTVRVAVLDTASDGPKGIIDRSGHGRAVGRVISELACGDLTSCAAVISHVPALSLDSREQFIIRQGKGGEGAIGTRGELASTINQVVTSWEKERDSGKGPKRLVINLSLGWSGCWESGQGSGPLAGNLLNNKRSLGSQEVIKALARASCAGALVVAAGGNSADDAVCAKEASSGNRPRHVFPGLWGGTPLQPEVCKKLFGREPAIKETVPLLIGIGAVEEDDDQLSITDHEADLVAYGQSLVVPDAALDTGYSLQLSGTSMSAAAVSGVAAAVLGYRPELSNPELLRLIRDAAVPLRAAPIAGARDAQDFICNSAFAAESCKEVRRVGLCRTLKEAKIGVSCAAASSTFGFATMSPIAPALPVVDCNSCGAACPAECSLLDEPDDSITLPWVAPQPKPPACGTCATVRSQLLFQAQFKFVVNHAVLKLFWADGSEQGYGLADADLAGTAPTTWQLPPGAAGATKAKLSYRVGTRKKQTGDVDILDLPPFTPDELPRVVLP